MNDGDQLSEHLRFFGELGVTGLSRDSAWRRRPSQESSAAQVSGPGDPAPVPQEFGAPGPASVAHEFGAPGPASVAHEFGAPDPASVAHEFEAPDPASVAQAFRPASAAAGVAASPTIQIARSADDVLRSIRTDIGEDCSRCKLHRLGRRQIVFGVGSPNAELMFVGEAPGADEDEQGIPFVGRAGQLLTKMIAAMGFEREQVYIANVIKCRPPQNRPPEPDEIASCEPFLFRQIDAIQPKVIVALGSFAAKTLLKTEQSISRLRGSIYDFRGAKLVPTFHPSYLLRSPDKKREAWQDLKTARALLNAPEN